VKKLSRRCKAVIPLALSFVGFGIAIFSVWFFLLRPWPGVVASDDATLINPPALGVYYAGDTLEWKKESICIPAGETTVQLSFSQPIPPEFGGGRLLKLAYIRVFYLDRPSCSAPSFTSVPIPADLQPGVYKIEIRACSNSPSPIDTCIDTSGPTVNVGKRDPLISPTTQ
jgi:hypothetical protein